MVADGVSAHEAFQRQDRTERAQKVECVHGKTREEKIITTHNIMWAHIILTFFAFVKGSCVLARRLVGVGRQRSANLFLTTDVGMLFFPVTATRTRTHPPTHTHTHVRSWSSPLAEDVMALSRLVFATSSRRLSALSAVPSLASTSSIVSASPALSALSSLSCASPSPPSLPLNPIRHYTARVNTVRFDCISLSRVFLLPNSSSLARS
jgi:hypothetical protein